MTRRAGHVLTCGCVLYALLATACSADPTSLGSGDRLEIVFQDLSGLPASAGRLEVWVYGRGDTLSVGELPAHDVVETFTFLMPSADVEGVFITVEPPDDTDEGPSRSVLLHGTFRGDVAQLTIEGAVTDGRALEDAPGAHSLFTTSNNVALGYPSYENAGLWLFSVAPTRNRHGTREVKLTPLTPGWVYEGWIVHQREPRVWLSYGKYRPDELSLLTSRDDSGAGPFSGDEDFRNAGVEDVPGEEWTTDRVALQLGIAWPDGLDLPIALDGVDATGRPLWHHVITIEPAADEAERPLDGRPFILQPYENPIGPGGPGEPRVIKRVNTGPSGVVKRVAKP